MLALVVAGELFLAQGWYRELRVDRDATREATARLSYLENNMELVIDMNETIADLKEEQMRFQSNWEELTSQPTALLPGLQELFSSAGQEITLGSVAATRNGELSVTAQTSDQFALSEWQGRLNASPVIARVISIDRVNLGAGPPFSYTLKVLVTGGKRSTEEQQR